MGRFEDLSGRRFGRLSVVERAANRGKSTMWLCKCECGATTTVSAGDLKLGKQKSCGCLRLEKSRNQEVDLTGKQFGRLTVIRKAEPIKFRDGHIKHRWECLCECGKTSLVRTDYLLQGRTKSCGCYQSDMTIEGSKTHGMSNTRLYAVWAGMKERTSTPSCAGYENYGGRGIRVCDEWMNSFEKFYNWAIANGYDENAPRGMCTIDRIDVNGDYEPGNCRWVDMKTQNNNRRPAQRKRT